MGEENNMDEKIYGKGLHPIQKAFYYAALVSVILGIGLILYLYYLFLYPIPTLKINKNPATIVTKQIHPGDAVVYELDFCKYTDLAATIDSAIIDHFVVLVPNTTAEFPEGCRTANFSIQTPRGIPVGHYHIVTTFKYLVNPLHEIDTTVSTGQFDVVN